MDSWPVRRMQAHTHVQPQNEMPPAHNGRRGKKTCKSHEQHCSLQKYLSTKCIKILVRKTHTCDVDTTHSFDWQAQSIILITCIAYQSFGWEKSDAFCWL